MKKKNSKTITQKKNSNPSNILIVCGEHSGDLLGSSLIQNMPKEKFHFFGIGGPTMISTGFSSSRDIESLAVIGFTAIFSKYFALKKIAKSLVDEAIQRNVQYAILIDYPGFNLYLAERLKEVGIKVIFFVSPQIWAWRFNRIFRIQKCVDLMLLLFPFEKKIYDKFEIPSVFVGHPLAERMKEKIQIEEPIVNNKENLKICLMPGSRKGEIHRLLIPILDSARKIQSMLDQKIEFLLPNINQKEENYIQSTLENYKDLKIQYYFDKTASSLKIADLVIVASGTATLEVAYFEKPMIIVYKLSPLSYWIGLMLVLTKHVGLVNILAEKEICKEFIQSACNVNSITEEALKIIKDSNYRENMIKEIKKVKSSLGKGDAGKKAAQAILKLIQGD